jgi:hypothetical protein
MDKVNNKPRYNSNYLDNVFQFRDFFGSFSTVELGALGHIFASILGCLFDISVAYYGDNLIIYFKLEENYPRLAK